MSRRKQNGDQEFGSDSFLDIIANIVGILIILIVIAGMKVARQPAHVAEIKTDSVLAAIEEPQEPAEASLLLALPNFEQTEDTSTDVVELPSFPELTNPFAELNSDSSPQSVPQEVDTDAGTSSALNSEIASLTLEIDNVGLEIAASEQRLAEMMQQLENQLMSSQADDIFSSEQKRILSTLASIESELVRGEDKGQGLQATLTSLTDRQQYITQALKQVSRETRRLQEVLNESEVNDATVDRLEHRISPVSRETTEGELHFQLAAGKVAHIPLERLLERLKEQVSQRRSVVQKFYRSEGIVGPVGGFRMNYIVERQAAAPLESMQYGGNAFRIMVSRWTILPAETLEAETVESAVKIGSRFRQVIESAEPNTVLTIWLYPDDFEKFGALRELGHRFNLRVAARPLPAGTPIAGSPSGSRSSSQ